MVDKAAERVEQLHADDRELHFARDEAHGAIYVQVRDLDGRVIRTIPNSEVFDVLAGASSNPWRICLSGLASGVDTRAIVSQLMAIERQSPIPRRSTSSPRPGAQGASRTSSPSSPRSSRPRRRCAPPDLWASKQTVESSDPTRRASRCRAAPASAARPLEVLALANSAQRSYGFTPPPRPAR